MQYSEKSLNGQNISCMQMFVRCRVNLGKTEIV